VQALGLVDRGLGVVREVRIDLERDPAILAAARVPHRLQDVAGAADVVARQRDEDLLRLGLGLGDGFDLLVVGVAVGDRGLEDRRVRRDADDAFVDEGLEAAFLNERARQVVDPDALAGLGQLLQGCHGSPLEVVCPT
jgi:hypothetical protein